MRIVVLFSILLLAIPSFGADKAVKKNAAATAKPEISLPFALTVDATNLKGAIAPKHAYCIGAAESAGNGENISPAVRWTKGPEGTKSYALIMHDPDVPTDFTDAGKKDKTIAGNMPRQVFYHWVLADIPAKTTEIPEGAEGKGTKNPGKPGKGKFGNRGVNDYTKFKGDGKTYGGYDGPCPPWNDARPHRYIFTLYALDVAKLELPKDFKGDDVLSAIKGHILAQSTSQGMYTLNPKLQAQ